MITIAKAIPEPDTERADSDFGPRDAVYPYRDADGTLLYEVLRLPGKAFAQRRPGSAPGRYVSGLGSVQRVPYRLPELLAGLDEKPNRAIFIAEGEKDVDRLTDLGLIATTNSSGAKSWRLEFGELFDGRGHAVILEDNDEEGRRRSEDLAAKLYSKVRSVKILRLPGLPQKGDVSDWLDAGGTVHELQRLVRSAPTWQPDGVEPARRDSRGDDSEPGLLEASALDLIQTPQLTGDLDYIPLLGRDGFLVRGWSHLIAGYPKVGKTELFLAMLWPVLHDGIDVLFITEEPRSIWEKRLAGFRPAYVTPADQHRLKLVFGLGYEPNTLRARMKRGSESLVILDTFRNLLCPDDETDNSQLAKLVNPWIRDARIGGKTLLVGHHEKKGGGENGEGITGGHALYGCFDIAVEVLRDPGKHDDRRLLKSTGRLITAQELVYERDAETKLLRALGDPSVLALEEVERRLAAVASVEPATTKEMRDRLDEPRPGLEQVRMALRGAAKRGLIRRDPPITLGEKKGTTYRWMAVESPVDSSDLVSTSASEGYF